MVATVRAVRLLGPMLFLVGLAALVVAFFENQATLSLFVIFPVVSATGAWAVLGILLMIAGFFLFFFTWPVGAEPPPARGPEPRASPATDLPSGTASDAQAQRRWGGVVFLGPVPVVFGSDPKVTRWMLILGFVLFAALLVLTVIALRGI